MQVPTTIHVLASADYAQRTGGYVYNNRLVAALAHQGIVPVSLTLATGFPSVPAPERAALGRRLAELGRDALVLTDHIHLCDLLDVFDETPVGVVTIFHHSLVVEQGDRDDPQARDLRAREQRAMDRAHRVLVTSHETAGYIAAHYGVEAQRIHVAVPGNASVARAPVGQRGLPISILSVGAIVPRKRYDYSVQVAAALADTDWRWTIVGDPDRYPQHLADLRRQVADLRLADRLVFLGDVSDAALEALWQASDLYVAASYYEGYGMAVAEALRHGVPVITTASGAVSTWASQAVVQAPADDAAGMASLIRPLLGDPRRLRALSDPAWAFGQTLPTWEETFEGVGSWVTGGV